MRCFRVIVPLLVAAFLFAADPLFAQNVEPNDGVHFELGLRYTLLSNYAKADGTPQGANVSGMRVRLPLTDRFSAVYMQLQIPVANSQIFLGGIEYRRVLSDFIKSPSTKVNLDRIQVYTAAGFGSRRDSNGNSPSFAYGFGGGAAYSVNSVISFSVEFGFLHAPLVHQQFVVSNTPTIAPGVQFRF